MNPQYLAKVATPSVESAETFKTLTVRVDCAPVRTLADARTLKIELQDAITALIDNFQERTGLQCEASDWKIEVRL